MLTVAKTQSGTSERSTNNFKVIKSTDTDTKTDNDNGKNKNNRHSNLNGGTYLFKVTWMLKYQNTKLARRVIFIDFEKAFDLLEWNFLFKVLEVMNFGPMFRKWIHTFYSERHELCYEQWSCVRLFSTLQRVFDKISIIRASFCTSN